MGGIGRREVIINVAMTVGNNGWNGATYGKQDPSTSTAADQLKKSKRPQEAVSISPGGTRSLSEAAGSTKRFRIWNNGGRMKRLASVGGIVVDIGDGDTERWRRQQRICGMATEEIWDNEYGIFGKITRDGGKLV